MDTPRSIVDANNQVIWQWHSDPFGTQLANQNPDTDSSDFEFNLRFPGQYFDTETQTHYNYFRDYEPGTGRYVQSDPIGVDAWVNTYSYVDNDSLSFLDIEGSSRRNKGNKNKKLNCGRKTVSKTPRGKGSTLPSKRDKRRLYNPNEKQEGFELQDEKCLRCGKTKDLKDLRAHHKKRHADGGKTDMPNLQMLCEPCHKWVHSK